MRLKIKQIYMKNGNSLENEFYSLKSVSWKWFLVSYMCVIVLWANSGFSEGNWRILMYWFLDQNVLVHFNLTITIHFWKKTEKKGHTKFPKYISSLVPCMEYFFVVAHDNASWAGMCPLCEIKVAPIEHIPTQPFITPKHTFWAMVPVFFSVDDFR